MSTNSQFNLTVSNTIDRPAIPVTEPVNETPQYPAPTLPSGAFSFSAGTLATFKQFDRHQFLPINFRSPVSSDMGSQASEKSTSTSLNTALSMNETRSSSRGSEEELQTFSGLSETSSSRPASAQDFRLDPIPVGSQAILDQSSYASTLPTPSSSSDGDALSLALPEPHHFSVYSESSGNLPLSEPHSSAGRTAEFALSGSSIFSPGAMASAQFMSLSLAQQPFPFQLPADSSQSAQAGEKIKVSPQVLSHSFDLDLISEYDPFAESEENKESYLAELNPPRADAAPSKKRKEPVKALTSQELSPKKKKLFVSAPQEESNIIVSSSCGHLSRAKSSAAQHGAVTSANNILEEALDKPGFQEDTIDVLKEYLNLYGYQFIRQISESDYSMTFEVEKNGKFHVIELIKSNDHVYGGSSAAEEDPEEILYFHKATEPDDVDHVLPFNKGEGRAIAVLKHAHAISTRNVFDSNKISSKTRHSLQYYFTQNGFAFKKVLGKGFSSLVYLATKDGAEFAVKLIGTSDHGVANATKFDPKKGDPLSLLMNHPNVLSAATLLYTNQNGEVSTEPTPGSQISAVIMPHFQGESLSSKLKQKKPFPENGVVAIGTQIASGLVHIHSLGIIHRDLKPDNVLMDSNGLVKVIDFGLARAIGNGEVVTSPVNQNLYAAPERWQSNPEYSFKSDSWTLGIMLYQMAVGKIPYTSQWDLLSPTPVVFPVDRPISDELKAVITGLLAFEPADRMSVEEAQKHLHQL